jgi:hypothetical protein
VEQAKDSIDGIDADNKMAASSAARPMSQISGVRRLQQSNSIVGIVPRFGVELDDEKPLAKVLYCPFVCCLYFSSFFNDRRFILIFNCNTKYDVIVCLFVF